MLAWRILDGTGCRGNEIAGLRISDVHLNDKYPHLIVEWHEERRVKTASSIRPVPLIGDALEAVREALLLREASEDPHLRNSVLGKQGFLFPQYVGPRGGDALSAALMKHVRKFTEDKRHVVYSLRHEATDRLRLAGVSKMDEDAIMGHVTGDVAVRHYGSERVALRMAYRAMERGLNGAEGDEEDEVIT